MSQCDMCLGSNHVANGDRCICLDGTQDGAMRGLRKIVRDQSTEVDRLQGIISGARAHSFGPYSDKELLRRVIVILNTATKPGRGYQPPED